jgi:glycosyltransferase involved in cell wall biosynthesis
MLASRFNVPRERIQTVLTPIDTDVFHPRDRREACASLNLSSFRRYILFVGRLDDRVKRVSSLLTVFGKLSEKYPDLDLIIIGDGSDSDSLGEMATRLLNGRCHLRGWVNSKEQLSAYYNISECLALPSMSEGFPTVVGEAIACGTPVAGSDVGGISEVVVPEQTGWLFPPDDEEALQCALTDVLEHPDKVQEMRSNARKIALQRVAAAAIVQQLRECLLGKEVK